MLQAGILLKGTRSRFHCRHSKSCVVCNFSVAFQKIVMLLTKPFCHTVFLVFFLGVGQSLLLWFVFWGGGGFFKLVPDSTTQGNKQILKDHFKLEQ